MSKKPHLKYSKQHLEIETFGYKSRGGDNSEKTSYDYSLKKKEYLNSIYNYNTEYQKRKSERNFKLDIPQYVSCIEFIFHGYFNAVDFENKYFEDFGFSIISYTELNTKALFAVANEAKFQIFIAEIEKFNNCTDHDEPDYNRNIKYIKSFKFHSTQDILTSYKELPGVVYLSIIDVQDMQFSNNILKPIETKLIKYLSEKNISSFFNLVTDEFEIKNISKDLIIEIAQNFDLIKKVSTNTHQIVAPSKRNIETRKRPFSIAMPSYDLPVIGVIDTGISVETPLKDLVVNTDNSYGLNGSNPRIDEAGEFGHGTSVAFLAAFGNQRPNNDNNPLVPDARLLSIKVLSNTSGALSTSDVLKFIRKAHEASEPKIKIFTLTINYDTSLKSSDLISEYAYALDLLAYELDILIFISTANNQFVNYETILDEYPSHFKSDNANISSPAESMNNITVGAIGDNLEKELPISENQFPLSSQSHPAPYTKKYHLLVKQPLPNSDLVKPDIVYSGGTYTVIRDDFWGNVTEVKADAGVYVLTNSMNDPFIRDCGTSLSTPLVANFAAKLIRQYPELKVQTIKALILNSTKEYDLKSSNEFSDFKASEIRALQGKGKPDLSKTLFSSPNEATFILEDKITVDTSKSYTLHIPKYLSEAIKNNTLLKFSATLCFKFKPVYNNHLGYCPVNIAFGLFRNISLKDEEVIEENGKNVTKNKGIIKTSKENYQLVKGWSQDAMYKPKLLSNSQKVTYGIKKDLIIQENSIFKIAVHAHFHRVLPKYITDILPNEYEFSLVIRLKDNQKQDLLQGKLYEELQLLNNLEVIGEAQVDAEVEL